jgi:phosphoribosyl 1,2-cyclic phosphodiesterase
LKGQDGRMDIKVLATGSDGNAYLVDKLLIEAGIPFKSLIKRLWDVGMTCTELDACLISHAHKDHSHCVRDLMKRGVDCYMSYQCAEELELLEHHRVAVFEPVAGYDKYPSYVIGTTTAIPFEAAHDIPCLGFVITSGKERLLYLTDSAYSPYTFPGLTHIMVAANYSLDILNENIEQGIVDRESKSRLLHSHASLDTVKEMLKANDLSNLCEVWLLHLSSRNSDAERFKKEVQEVVGVPVYIY